MPLIPSLPAEHDPEVAELARFFHETLGFVPRSVLTMQRRPAIARAFIGLNRAVMSNEGRVTSEQKRLIGLLASTAAGMGRSRPLAGWPRAALAWPRIRSSRLEIISGLRQHGNQ